MRKISLFAEVIATVKSLVAPVNVTKSPFSKAAPLAQLSLIGGSVS